MRKLHACLNCGTMTHNKKFCSHDCSYAYTLKIGEEHRQQIKEETQKLLDEGKVGHPCKYCGKMTLNKTYCNNECRYKDANSEHSCLNCGKMTKKSKFCCRKCSNDYRTNTWAEKWKSGEENIQYKNNHWGNVPAKIRNYLLKKYDYKCTRCGCDDAFNPYSKTWTLEIDHIDGNYKNNTLENLTVLCPNCHALTEFYGGTSVGCGHRREKTWRPIKEES